MKTGIVCLTLWICAAVLGGCATIVNGNTQQMSFQSSPEGATITIIAKPGPLCCGPRPAESVVLGKTPLTTQMMRTEFPQAVVFSKEGHAPIEMPIGEHLSGWYFGNILVGGLIGSTTDISTGAAAEYAPDKFFAVLSPLQTTAIERNVLVDQRDRTRLFILNRHSAIVGDFSRGTGEDLDALLTLLQIPQSQRRSTQESLYWLSQRYPDPLAFADQVAATYPIKQTASGCGPGASC
jgi:hypothetical protein